METIKFKDAVIEVKETACGKMYRVVGKKYWRRSLVFAYMVTNWESEDVTEDQRNC